MIEVPPDRALLSVVAWFREAGWSSVADLLSAPETDHFIRHYFVWALAVIAILCLYGALANLLKWLFAKVSRQIGPVASSGVNDPRERQSTPNVHRKWLPARFRIIRKLRVWLFSAKRRAVPYWRLIGPYDYSVPATRPDVTGHYYSRLSNDRVAFSERFADAFPGTRDLLTMSDPDSIIHRLNVLLRWPVEAVVLKQGAEVGHAIPFYWNSGDGNMHIHRYVHYKRRMILLNEMEIRPAYLAAIGGDIYWSTYVYLEAAALPPRRVRGEEDFEYAEYQEFAIYNGAVFNRREYDDGSYLKNGKPIRFSVRPDLRTRNLRAFGFLLIPNSSPANNPHRDREIESHIDHVIQDKREIGKFSEYLQGLPKER